MKLKRPPPKFSCCSCGACCCCTEVELQPGDVVPREYLAPDGRHLRAVRGPDGRDGRCAALVGELGKPGVRCAIYDSRPKICREVKRYDPLCFATRWHFQLPGGRLDAEVEKDVRERHGGDLPLCPSAVPS